MRRILAIALTTALLFNAPSIVYAREMEETTSVVETQESVDGSESDTFDFVSGYIPSDLDYNTPGYENEIALYSDVPSSYGSITEVRNTYPENRDQNPYGTCWAFSSIGLAEFDLINDGVADKNIDLSELQLAYFTFNSVTDPLGGTEGDSAKYYNENASNNYLNYGSNYEMASRRLAQWVGAAKESDVPYSTASSVLNNGVSDGYAYNADVTHLQNAYLINIKQNPTDVKQQIMEHGAVGIMYAHNDSGLSWNDARSEYNYYDTNGLGGGHAVMVVGWDDNYSKDNFIGNQPPSDGAWLIRNSWGIYCSYFWMSYETFSLSDTAWAFDFSTNDGFDNNYQLDGGLQAVENKQYTTMANVFTAKTDADVKSETLKAVSVSFTHNASVNYTIEVYTNLTDVKNPTSGTKQESATTQGTTAYAGIYTIELADEVEIQPGSSFAIVVSVDKYALEYEQAMTIATGDNLETIVWDCTVSLNNQKTFYKSGSSFHAWPWGNLCVKAFTSDNKDNTPDTPITPEEKTYTITYNLDGGTNNSSNPSTYKTGNSAIILNAPTKSGYTFNGWYTDSAYTNRITEIPSNSTTNYTLYAKWNANLPDMDSFAISNKDAIADGVYVIKSIVDSRYVFDVSDGSNADGANVQLYYNNNTAAQQWKITHDDKGYITLTNIGSGKVLDVSGAETKNGTNIQQYTSAGNNAQRWVAVKQSDGSYIFVSALDIKKGIDLSNASAHNGANIQLYELNNTKAQRWSLSKCASADDLALEHRNDISDGTYIIRSAVDNGFVFDVSNGSYDNGANIQLYADNGTGAQQWTIQHDSDGYIILTNVGSGKVLDVAGAVTANGTNIQQYETNGNKAQKWIGIKNSDGTVKFISGLDVNKVVDLSNGSPYNGANIQLYESNGTKAQNWIVSKCASIEDIADAHRNDILDGTYIIKSAVDNSFALDVSNASTDNGANVQLFSSNGTNAQKWQITHDASGFVTIINIASGKALDIDNANTANGSNIQQYESNNTKAQKWIVVKNKNGSFEIISALDVNKCLDLSNASASNGANIQIYESNSTTAQCWRFEVSK